MQTDVARSTRKFRRGRSEDGRSTNSALQQLSQYTNSFQTRQTAVRLPQFGQCVVKPNRVRRQGKWDLQVHVFSIMEIGAQVLAALEGSALL